MNSLGFQKDLELKIQCHSRVAIADAINGTQVTCLCGLKSLAMEWSIERLTKKFV